jgi:large subunit ribosomal protein L30
MAKLAVVQVRGTIRAPMTVVDTLKSLNLQRQNYCTVVEDTPHFKGMLAQAKDYITWGEIDDATYKALVEKRGEEFKGRATDSKKKVEYSHSFKHGAKALKKYFRLNPPRKGWGKKGLKASFPDGGAFGYRGAKMNELIMRML